MVIVPGRPAADALTWWILADTPAPLDVELVPAEASADVVVHELPDLSDHGDARAYLIATTGLRPDTAYDLIGRTDDGEQRLRTARTLPESLTPGAPFTIALGSCYNAPMDLEEVWRWYPPAGHEQDSADPLRLRFLLGDQIYMDLEKEIEAEKPTSWSRPLTEAPDPWAAYLDQWRSRDYDNLLGSGPPSLFLADDHEMWNDYPHTPPWLPWSKGDDGRALARQLRNAWDVFQAALNLAPRSVAAAGRITHTTVVDEGYSVRLDVPPLSFFALDTRLGRTRADTPGAVRFTDPAHLDAVADWLAEPGGLGVLALGPPAFAGKGTATDRNLADYEADYDRLVDTLADARKRVLILAGDIHYTRLFSVSLKDPGDAAEDLRIAELTSSALSRLKEAPGMKEPSGPDAECGWLGDSGARYVLEPDDLAGGRFVTTVRQSYATVTFTHDVDAGVVRATHRAWGPPGRRSTRAMLLLERTLAFPTDAP